MLLPSLLSAATLCVGPSATGSGTGADWSNIKAFTTSFARGDTWYLQNGSYTGPFNMSSATSGTTLNTIVKATVADHGTATGWSDSYAAQAAFTSTTYCLGFSSQYWTVNGQANGNTGGTADATVASYGIRLTTTGTTSSSANAIQLWSGNCSHSTFKYIAMLAPLAATGDATCVFNEKTVVFGSVVSTNMLLQRCYLYGGVVGSCFTGSGSGGADQANIVEYCWYEYQGGIQHSETVQLSGTHNVTFRYNVFKDLLWESTTYIEPQSNGGPDCQGIYVYGNVFVSTSASEGTDNASCLSLTSGEIADTISFYNNTIFDLNGHAGSDSGLGLSSGGNDCTNVTVRNNIWQACTTAPGGTGVGTWSNNRLNTGTAASFTNTGTGDFHLTADTAPSWFALSSPYDTDPDGVPRTSSIGAFQFISASVTPAASPSFLRRGGPGP